MKTLIALFLALATSQKASEFDSYLGLSNAGFYFSPGYDCHTSLAPGQVLFTATFDENYFSVFSKAGVELDESASGYRIAKISKVWISGQSVECNIVSPAGSEAKIAIIDWTFDTDPGEGPDHFSFVAALNKDGHAQVISCDWSYGKPEVLMTKHGLVTRYTMGNGKKRDVAATAIDSQC